MHLYLVRHGPAATRDPRRWPDDEERPLSPDGVRKTRLAARAFVKQVGAVPRIAASPARRALRTAEVWAGAMDPSPRVVRWPELAIGVAPMEALDRIRREWSGAASGVVVGHAPGLAEMIGLALTGETAPIAHLSKAGCAAIEFPRKVAPGAGRLDWLLTRRQWAT